MNAKQTIPKDEDQREKQILERIASAQEEFESHWLWNELKTTPKEFFVKVNDYMTQSGIDSRVWQRRLDDAKKSQETRYKERSLGSSSTGAKLIRGIRI